MAAERGPGDFGSRLREARERRGMSLREISNATKISVAVLDALEHNDITRLPGGIFSRAFVRSYASEVGLDPERTVHEFIAAFPEDSVAAGHPAAPIEDNESLESDRQTATTFLQLIGLSVLVAATMWLVVVSRDHPEQPPAAVAAEPVPSPVPAPQSAAPDTDSADRDQKPVPLSSPSVATAGQAVPAANRDSARPAAPEPAPADHLTVGLAVTRPCWITLTVDGEKAIERLLRPGDQRTFEVQRELVLTAGDAAAVALTINGAEARPLGRTGQVATARINPASFKDYLPRP